MSGDIDNDGTTTVTGNVDGGVTSSGDTTIGGSVGDNVAVTGGTTEIGGDVDGDVTNAGTTDIGGDVTGKVTSSGETTVDGHVGAGVEVNDGKTTVGDGVTGDVTVANGSEAEVTGNVSGDIDNNGTTTVTGNVDGGVTSSGDTTISGNVGGDVTVTGGETIVDGTIGGDAENSGKLKADADKISGTITNNTGAEFTTGGVLDKEIYGGGTTKVDDEIAINSGAKVDGTLDINGGEVTISEGAITSHDLGTVINSVAGDGVLNIDLNLETGEADKIRVASDSTGSVKLGPVNIIGATVDHLNKDFNVEIVEGSDNFKLTSDADTFDGTEYIIEEKGAYDVNHVVEAVTDWSKVYQDKHVSAETVKGQLGLNDSQTGIKVSESSRSGGEETYTNAGDALALVNQADIADRTFSTNDANAVYNVGEKYKADTGIDISDIGETEAGIFNVSGKKEGGSTSTINFGDKGGFNLEKATTLNMSDVEINSNGTVVTLDNDAAKLVTNADTVINGGITNKNGAVDNAGSISGAVENSGELTNSGSISGGITNTNKVTNNSGGSIVGIDNSGEVENSGTLSGVITNSGAGAKITTSASGIAEGSTVVNDAEIIFNGGENKNVISGSGHTEIASGANVVNSAKINQEVRVSGELTSTAENLGGAITNNGTLNLSGALGKAVSGAGETNIDGTLELKENGAVDGTLDMNGGRIVISDGSITSHNINDIIGEATMAMDLDLSDSTIASGDRIVVNSNGVGSLTLDKLNLTGEMREFEYKVLEGTDDNFELKVADGLASQYHKEHSEKEIESYTINTDTNWRDVYDVTEKVTTTSQDLGVKDKNTLQYKTSVNTSTEVSRDEDTLMLVNQYDGIGTRNFNASGASDRYEAKADMGKTAAGELNINGKASGAEKSTIDLKGHSGFEINNDNTTINLNDVKLTGGKDVIKSIKEDSTVNVNNSEISGNEGGIKTMGAINVNGKTTIGDDIVLMGANGSVNIRDNNKEADLQGKITGVSGSKLNITNSTIDIKSQIAGVNTVLNNTTLNMAKESLLSGDLTVGSASTANMVNNGIGAMTINNMVLNGILNIGVDVDLANSAMDRIIANSVSGDGYINVANMNLLSDAPREITQIPISNEVLKDRIRTAISTVSYSPIYKYDVSYNPGNGLFTFVRGFTDIGGGSDWRTYNPAVLSAPVLTQAGGQVTMAQTFGHAFEHSDVFMKSPYSKRMAATQANVYAMSTDFNENMSLSGGLNYDETNKAVWVKPYTTFENVNLDNGPKVDVIGYGTLIGGDSDFRKLRHGWTNVGTLYVGYNGSQVDYAGISGSTNGGILGITETFYRGNFFNATTINAGAAFGEANTMYGKDDVIMIMGGIANKTGYNIEFKEGKYIIQPNLMLSYSMIKTLDYTNAAGVRINADPLHTIMLNPNVRFVANLKNGWQPYASVGMIWNLMNKTNMDANGHVLPQMHTKPYVEYGVGLQKSIGERFTGYAQAMMRNGGRNGIALTVGFRWALGGKAKEKKNKNVKPVNTKLPEATGTELPKVEFKIRDVEKDLNNVTTPQPTPAKDNLTNNTPKQKTVIKSLNKNANRQNINKYISIVDN